MSEQQDPASIFLKYDFLYCWVERHEITQPEHEFNFKFKLWINRRVDPVIFSINYKKLNGILHYVQQEKIYFAAHKLPSSMYTHCISHELK